jgi:hypothetical protein
MEEPPGKDEGAKDDQAEGLIAAIGEALLLAARLLGLLLVVRLDAPICHGVGSPPASWPDVRLTTHQYRGVEVAVCGCGTV